MSEHLENLRDEDEQGYQDWCNARDKAEARVKELEAELEKAQKENERLREAIKKWNELYPDKHF